jgi:hypothetical protein
MIQRKELGDVKTFGWLFLNGGQILNRLIMVACVVLFSVLYFRSVTSGFQKEGARLGAVCLAISLFIDLLLFMEGPMKMPLADYLKDIGLTYLIIPIITVGFGYLLERCEQ